MKMKPSWPSKDLVSGGTKPLSDHYAISRVDVCDNTDLYQIDTKQRRSRPSDRKSRAPGADRPRPQREFARAPLAASNSTDTTAFATGYIACTVHMSLNIALQTTWLCT